VVFSGPHLALVFRTETVGQHYRSRYAHMWRFKCWVGKHPDLWESVPFPYTGWEVPLDENLHKAMVESRDER